MKRVIYVVILLAVAAAFYVYAYPRLAGGGVANAQSAPAAGGHGGGFPTSVVVAVAKQQTMPITKSAVGLIEPIDTVVVHPQVSGIVTAQHVTDGQMVKAGDLLFKLDDSTAQAVIAKDQASLARDQANLDSANADLSRANDLFKKQVDTQQQLDVAIAAQKSAAALIGIDQAQIKTDQLTLADMTITAPIDGRVGVVNTSVGNLVSTATPADGLLTITRMAPVRVSFAVAEGDLDSFRAALAKSKTVPVAVTAAGDTSPRSTGTLDFIDSSVDSTSGTVVVKAQIDNQDGKLWPGQYVTAVTQVGAYDNATTIPVVAVQQSDQGPYVFVSGGDKKARKSPVNVLANIGDTAVIGSGVKPGDHVVVEGQLHLNDGSLLKETVSDDTKVASNNAGAVDASATPAAAAQPATNQ